MASPDKSKRSFSKKEISQLFLIAKRMVRSPGLDILLAPSISMPGRLLIITPAKIGNAPERNLVRRRLKALFYERHLGKEPFDCIILVKKPGISLTFDQLERCVKEAYLKVKPHGISEATPPS